MNAAGATVAANAVRVNLASWVHGASRDSVLFLPRVEAHAAGASVALGSFLLGLWAAQGSFSGHQFLAWVALAGVMLGMLLHWRWKKANAGWRVDFEARRIEPVGLRGEVQVLTGAGWSISVAPGTKRSHVAIDLRHGDRGQVARLLDTPARGRADASHLDQLADHLALRLGVPRVGLRL